MASKLPGSGPHVYVLLWRDCGGNEFVALGAYAHLKDANAEAKRLGKEQLSDGLTYSSMQADLKAQDSEPLRSLARFAFHDSTVPSSSPTLATAPLTPDIEDGLETNPRKRRRVVTKVEPVIKAPPSPNSKPASASPRKRRKPARVIKGESPSGDTVEGPSDWEEMYELVRQMRLGGTARDAAVDTMGCERLFSPTASDRDRRFQILISLMMSSQTKDAVNAVAMGRLHDELPPHEAGAPPGLNLENILAVEPAKLNELIRVVGFHNNKTKFIKQAALLLRDNFDADIPPTIDGLTSLPGVGPKMAHLCLSAAWGRTEGIGVDVHVHRITNMWGWHKTASPEASRLALEAWLPRDRWHEINTLLVGLGQTVCLPQAGRRRCGECDLGLRGLCRGADRKKVALGRAAGPEGVKVKEDDVPKADVLASEFFETRVTKEEGHMLDEKVVSIKREAIHDE
ncbi:Endonuclease III like protein [Verticillium longisporum]|nr:Endonuclease III like protein [Verticillium longisporum]